MKVSSANDRTPYTYVVAHLPTGKRYYGSRYSRRCDPSDLWVSYFTSSRRIRQMVKEEGKGAFVASVRRIFPSIETCLRWETFVLRRLGVPKNDRWFNKSIGGKRFYSSLARERNPNYGKHWTIPQEVRDKIGGSLKNRKLSDTHRQRISLAVSGARNPMFGSTHSPASRSRISMAGRMRRQSADTKRRIAESEMGSKNHNYGKRLSDRHRLRLLDSCKGTVWMNNGEHSRRVKPERVSPLEAEGWHPGR